MRAKILGALATIMGITIFIEDRRYGVRPFHDGEADTD